MNQINLITLKKIHYLQFSLPDFCQINCVCLENSTITQSDQKYVKMLDYLPDNFSIKF